MLPLARSAFASAPLDGELSMARRYSLRRTTIRSTFARFPLLLFFPAAILLGLVPS